jgi:hypothetical protein
MTKEIPWPDNSKRTSFNSKEQKVKKLKVLDQFYEQISLYSFLIYNSKLNLNIFLN